MEVRLLRRFLGDSNANVRAGACTRLRRFAKDPMVQAHLACVAAGDPDVYVRQTAKEVLAFS